MNDINLHSGLFSILLNQFLTSAVFLHMLTPVCCSTLLLILSRMHLLIFPISALVRFIRRYLGLVLKFGLWSFMVMNGSFFAVVSILSSSPSFSVMIIITTVLHKICHIYSCIVVSSGYYSHAFKG